MNAIREPANALTHLAGSVLALAALAVLARIGLDSGSGLALLGLLVYGLSQLALYTASTLHHALRISPVGMEVLLQLDCMLVFVFIAGTYTPVCLIALHGGWRWGLLGAVWGMTAGGFALRLWWPEAPVLLNTALYVAMGWVALGALPALSQAVPGAGMWWFGVGGIIYTLGVLVFLLDRPWPRAGVFEAHAIWHLFVIGGSCCCFWAIVHYVAPLA